MKPDENEKFDEMTSQDELGKLLEQKQNETEALKRLIGILEKKDAPIPKKGSTE